MFSARNRIVYFIAIMYMDFMCFFFGKEMGYWKSLGFHAVFQTFITGKEQIHSIAPHLIILYRIYVTIIAVICFPEQPTPSMWTICLLSVYVFWFTDKIKCIFFTNSKNSVFVADIVIKYMNKRYIIIFMYIFIYKNIICNMVLFIIFNKMGINGNLLVNAIC